MPLSMVPNDLYSYMDEESIHPLLICRFCSKPFVDPVSTQNGDCFCRSCIPYFLLQNSSHENSRTDINSEQQLSKMQTLTPVTEKLILEMLDTLLVQCVKCGEINIKRGQLREHENQTCTQAPVLCRASEIKCSWMGTREKLNDHLEQCKFEQIRPALESIFDEHSELQDRIQHLQTQIDELMNVKMLDKININS